MFFEVHRIGYRKSEITQYQVWAFTHPHPDDDNEDDIEDLDGGRNVLEAFRAVAARLLDPVELPNDRAFICVEKDGEQLRQGSGDLFMLATLPQALDGARVIVFDIGSSLARCDAAGWIGHAPGPDGREAAWGPLRPSAQEAIAAAWEVARANRRNGAHNASA